DGGDLPGGSHAQDALVHAVEARQRGHVARAAVVIARQHLQLLSETKRADAARRPNAEGDDLWLLRPRRRRAAAEPSFEDLIIDRTGLQALTALVRNGSRRFAKEQTRRRSERVRASTETIADNGAIIIFRGEAEHRQFETALAVLAGVAGAGVAAR